MKICTRCAESKPTAEFYSIKQRGKPSIDSQCKLCRCANAKAWRDANPEKANAPRASRNPKGRRPRDPEKRKAYDRKYNASDKAREARRLHAKTDKGKLHRQRFAQRVRWPRDLMKTYGLTVEAYAWILYDQGFACAICEHPFSADLISSRNLAQMSRERPCVDHCHTTGKVRGLLCNWCNYGLVGPIDKAGEENFRAALRYLGHWVDLRGYVSTSIPCE